MININNYLRTFSPTTELIKNMLKLHIDFAQNMSIPSGFVHQVSSIVKHIDSLQKTQYDSQNLKDKKIRALCNLVEKLITNSYEKSPSELVDEWKADSSDGISNYELMSMHRRTSGIYSLFTKSKTNTQKFIDNLCDSFATSPDYKLSTKQSSHK